MRWYSTNGEYAFFAVGSVARGVIAVGGVAHGVLAIGGFVSVGVVSIGMNAIGSVLAVGMNAVGPIALSLINALGFFVLAGVNGWGAWSQAGANAAGLAASGGANSDFSVVPAVVVITLSVVLSSVLRGKRERREDAGAVRLAAFLRSPGPADARVVAELGHVDDASIELVDGGEALSCRAEPSVAQLACEIADGSFNAPARVVVRLRRSEEDVPESNAPPAGYRARIRETRREVVTCVGVEAAPPRETWLPKDAGEVQWVVAWSSRAAVVAMLVALAVR